MKKKLTLLFFFYLLSYPLVIEAQLNTELLKTELIPYRIDGRKTPFSRKLSFGSYKTTEIRRSISSYTALGTINPINPLLIIESVPLQRKDKYKVRDRFRFKLKKDNVVASTIECRELLAVNEKFRLTRSQDSSFFGSSNTDFLIASIILSQDTLIKWALTATNLNATKDEEQKGILFSGDNEIIFELKNLMLKEYMYNSNINRNFSSLQPVYAFTYKNEIIAAVTVKESNRTFWIKENTHETIKTAIAATASLLIMRGNLYR